MEWVEILVLGAVNGTDADPNQIVLGKVHGERAISNSARRPDSLFEESVETVFSSASLTADRPISAVWEV